jgi:ketosteroid isomerase-like protein
MIARLVGLGTILTALLSVGCASARKPGWDRNPARHPDDPLSADFTDDGFSLNIYHNVVRQKVLKGFSELNRGSADYIIELLDDDVRYRFVGSHALGGERFTKAAVTQWFARLLRLFSSRFRVHGVEVSGWPWDTTVIVRYEDVATPKVGETYVNPAMQVTKLRWGSIVDNEVFVDSRKISAALEYMATHGIEEAGAPPITD